MGPSTVTGDAPSAHGPAAAAPSAQVAGARNVFDAVAWHAEERPDADALSGAGRTWTFRSLVDQGERLAAAFASRCGEPGARVAVVADNHPLTCVVYLACARAGLVVSLVSSLFGRSELAVVLAKLEPHLVIADAAHRAAVDGALLDVGQEPIRIALERDGTSLPSMDAWLVGSPLEGPRPEADAILEITWTSGTTSAPKGAMLTHEAALTRAACEIDLFGLDETDAAAVITPLFHQSGIRNTVLATWVAGGHAVVLPRFDVATFWADMAHWRVTYLCMVETILLMLERNAPCAAERDNTLRRVLAAGDPEVVRRCEARFGLRVVQVWGMTETGVSTGVPRSLPIGEVNALRDWARAPVAGWALGSSRLRLMSDGEEVSGEGAQGEIQFASPMLFAGYFRDPEASAAAFDGPWFKTGDLGLYGLGGILYFLDRIRDVIRRGGENIASKQVEDALMTHPRVRRTAVVPVPDPLFLQEVMAVVVPDGEVTPDELWSWCEARLARYKVPRYIRFADALPTNGSGRVLKRQLAETALADAGGLFDRRAASARP